MDIDDGALVHRIRAGDLAAFGLLIGKYQRKAHGVALGYLWNTDDAYDAVQDAFIDAYLNLHGLQDGDRFAAWFFTIVRRKCWRLSRRRNRNARLEDQVASISRYRYCDSQAAGHPGFADIWCKLSDADRQVLELSILDGYSYGEIARRLGVTEGAVKTRAHRARSRILREAMSMQESSDRYSITFTRQTVERLLLRLASMEEGSMPTGLDQIARETTDPDLAGLAHGLATILGQGQSLDRAMLLTRTLPPGISALVRLGREMKREKDMLGIAASLLGNSLLHSGAPIGGTEAGTFLSTLQCLLRTGVPLLQAIDMSGKRVQGLSQLADGILSSIRSGRMLADSFAEQHGIFTDEFISILRLAEATATLEAAFASLAVLLWYPDQMDTSRIGGDLGERMQSAQTLIS